MEENFMTIGILTGYIVLHCISLYIIFYDYLYLRTSSHSKELVGTSIHPLTRRTVQISMLLAIGVAVVSLFFIIYHVAILLGMV